MTPSRRTLLATGAAALVFPTAARAGLIEIGWDDLIPPGVPYSEIIAEGEIDVVNDTWNPIFDENGIKLNDALNGALIRMPGFIIPLELNAEGVTDFMLVPYVGACMHLPPPPPNQLVVARAETPWPDDALWDPVWVVGELRTELQSTELAQVGYSLRVDEMETYVW